MSREETAEYDIINGEKLMGPALYAQHWNNIGNAKMPNDPNLSSGCTPFWKEVEDAINELMKE
eukprot:497164-Ditylum_brightwellii.AAC.1